MSKIKKGDNVVVLRRQRQGQARRGVRACSTGKVLVEGINKAKKHQRPNPMKGHHGRHRDEGDADPRVECGDLEPDHAEGRSRRHASMLDDGRQRALLQVQRRVIGA